MSKNVLNNAEQIPSTQNPLVQTPSIQGTSAQAPLTQVQRAQSPLAQKPPQDFTALALALQEVAESLLDYGKMFKTRDEKENTNAENMEAENTLEKNTKINAELNESPYMDTFGQIKQAMPCTHKIEFTYNSNAIYAFEKQVGPIKEAYKSGEFHKEIRSYSVPAFIVRNEYELLSRYEQDTFFDLTHQAYGDLNDIISLLGYMCDAEEVSYDKFLRIQRNLTRPMNLFKEICSQLADFKLIHIVTVPV